MESHGYTCMQKLVNKAKRLSQIDIWRVEQMTRKKGNEWKWYKENNKRELKKNSERRGKKLRKAEIEKTGNRWKEENQEKEWESNKNPISGTKI